MLILLRKQTKVTGVGEKLDTALASASDRTNSEVTFMPEGEASSAATIISTD